MRQKRLVVSLWTAAAIASFAALTYAAASWPDLTTLTSYPNPFGSTCDVAGAPGASAAKQAENKLKNRFTLPPSITPVLLSALLVAAPGSGGAPVPSTDAKNNQGISVAGYVRAVKRGGTEGESCNCNATGNSQVDTHIELVLDPMDTSRKGTHMLVVETTERSRRLAAAGLLPTNIGNNWSYSMLHSKLLGRWVRFSGWRFYDPDHHLESWAIDPTDTVPKKNWRGTCWEIHPVLGIQRLSSKPSPL